MIHQWESSLPDVKESKIEKVSRKHTKSPRSKIILDGDLTLFVEHDEKKNYPKGGFGQVKQCFVSEDSEDPIYAMKRLFKPKIGEMIKEVKYLNLTGKGFYASRNNKYYIFSPGIMAKH